MRAIDFVHSYFEAWNDRDPVAVADHLADDGTYCDVPLNIRRNHDELIISLQEFFAQQQHRYELIGEILEGDHTIAFRYRMYPLVQDRKQPKPDPVNGAEFITLTGDTALTIHDYYDSPGAQQPLVAEAATRAAAKQANTKYAKSGLKDDQLGDYKARLQQVMEAEQAYLRSDLTLPRLAELVDCSVNHLSQVINAGFGVSFFDYLNRYRIQHAKRLLRELDGQSSAVLNIAFTVGFNSNSAFYAAFKKNVGQTPAQYRRHHADHRP